MKKKALFAVVWIVLFGATYGISALTSQGAKTNSAAPNMDTAVSSEIADDLLIEELNKLPRNTLIIDSVSQPEFERALSDHILAHAEILRPCWDSSMSLSNHRKTFLEVSFVLAPIARRTAAEKAGYRTVRLDEVVFERATTTLTTDEKNCIVRAFADFEVSVQDYPTSRYPFQFCVGRRPDHHDQSATDVSAR